MLENEIEVVEMEDIGRGRDVATGASLRGEGDGKGVQEEEEDGFVTCREECGGGDRGEGWNI